MTTETMREIIATTISGLAEVERQMETIKTFARMAGAELEDVASIRELLATALHRLLHRDGNDIMCECPDDMEGNRVPYGSFTCDFCVAREALKRAGYGD